MMRMTGTVRREGKFSISQGQFPNDTLRPSGGRGELLTILVDQSQRTVFQFTGKDTLGMHVGKFLNLKSCFQAGGVLIASAHDEQTPLSCNSRSKLLNIPVQCQDLANLPWKLVQTVNDGTASTS
jgi:hypothetical protein